VTGEVVFVRGWSGAEDLVPVRALDRLSTADVVILDRPAPPALLRHLPEVELIDARLPAGGALTHEEIIALVIDRARCGKDVVRLVADDPFVSARGVQELASCTAAGLSVEVIPAAPAAVCAVGAVAPRHPGRRVLVLGGSRSGKSRHAEQLASAAGGPVSYVATGAGGDDREWNDRVERHRARRPAEWATVETRDLAALLGRDEPRTFLIDSVTTWLAGLMDDCGCWGEGVAADAERHLQEALTDLVRCWASCRVAAIAVSDEVGSGIVPSTASGRRFRDLLGELNQRLAAEADEVWLVTAGIPSRLR